jgi:glyoxylase-like metal-dependent hydrolase (beta-lactamase superfamily II)
MLAEQADEAPHLGERLTSGRLDHLERLPLPLLLRAEQPTDRAGLHRHHRDGVRDDVVELARDPPALLGDGTVCRGDRVLLGLLRGPFHPGDASATVAAVEVQRVDEGLWHWTAPHPEWKPGDDWERDVGCVYWEAGDAVVLVDPLVPTDEADRSRFLEALDRDVERVALPVAILLTCDWHGRSQGALAERYDARVFTPPTAERLPGSATALDVPEEVVYWLPAARALVPGDTLLGTPDGLTLCPASWFDDRGSIDELARSLTPLLDLPVERVLTTHGPPVLADGHAALARALAAAA